jgi:hypothetical protein
MSNPDVIPWCQTWCLTFVPNPDVIPWCQILMLIFAAPTWCPWVTAWRNYNKKIIQILSRIISEFFLIFRYFLSPNFLMILRRFHQFKTCILLLLEYTWRKGKNFLYFISIFNKLSQYNNAFVVMPHIKSGNKKHQAILLTWYLQTVIEKSSF